MKRRVTTQRGDRKIIASTRKNKKITLKGLKSVLSEQRILVNPRTLRRRLAEAGFRGRKPAKKPRLTIQMK